MGKDFELVKKISSKLNNHKLSLGDAEEVTYNINESGNDSGSSPYTIYFNHGRPAFGVTIRATVACSVTVLNGKTLKSPLTINPNTNELDELLVSSFTLVSTLATVIEVSIK